MAKKTGANRDDVVRILELEADGLSAQQISDLMDIVLSTILSFLSGPQQLDLDGDGKPDTELLNAGGVRVTHDADGVNIDVDGDGKADVIIPHK